MGYYRKGGLGIEPRTRRRSAFRTREIISDVFKAAGVACFCAAYISDKTDFWAIS